MDLATRLQTTVLRAALDLPVPAQRRLAGRAVEIDGQRLAPELQLMLRLQELVREPHIEDLPLAQARAAMVKQARMVGGDQSIGAVRDLSIAGAVGVRRARLYTPTMRLGAEPRPTLLFFHGGGMMYGDLDSHDAPCRFLAEQSGVQVLAVDYRLAPEHPYPAAVDDAEAAYRWLLTHTDELLADPERLGVGGDSAGGYLSAAVALMAADEGLPLAAQLLVYPATDFTRLSGSRLRFGEGFFLSAKFMDGATAAYFRPEHDRADPRASVLMRREVPAGLAPALVYTCGFDPLRDEGEAYADLLASQGAPVVRRRFTSMIHGFFNVVGCGHEAPANNRAIAADLRRALA